MVTITLKGVGKTVSVMNRVVNWVNVELKDLTFNKADRGSQYLINRMPKDSKAMAQAVAIAGTTKGYKIVSRTPKSTSWDGKTDRPYHIHYNDGKRGRYKGNKRTGDYNYYEKTAEYLGKEYPEAAQKSLSEQLQRG